MGYYLPEGRTGNRQDWQQACFKEKAIFSEVDPVFVLLVMTGTFSKYSQALMEFNAPGESVIPAKNIEQFVEASLASEPVTHDSEFLIFGKQRGQRKQLLIKLDKDASFRSRFDGQRIITTLNDINTSIGKRTLTKTRLQKEGDLSSHQYEVLIRASLKYLLASTNNLLDSDEISWEKIASSYESLCEFDQKADCLFEPGKSYVLPIDFQSIDAFEVLDVDAPKGREARVKQVGPRVAVLHQSFANIEFLVDQRGKMSSFDQAVNNYVSTERNFDRCPLGIYFADLFNSMVSSGMNVSMSVVGHEEAGVNLQENYIVAANDMHELSQDDQKLAQEKYSAPMDLLELRQNGFSRESFAIANEVFGTVRKTDADKILFVRCRPKTAPYFEWKNAPRYLN